MRPERVKKTAHELVKLYRNKFSANFQNNKEAVESLTRISSNKLRNRIAGYITSLLSLPAKETEESEVEADEGNGQEA